MRTQMSYRKSMNFTVVLKPKAIKDLKAIRKDDASRIADALERLQNNLLGDVKKLTNFIPAYRLRVGNYRILFEVEEESQVTVYRVIHRREAYR
jgi:mRNA interferase RelE/StbE